MTLPEGPHNQELKAIAWQKGRLSWLLHENQAIIHAALENLPPDIKEAVLLCCRRFGKSFLGCVYGAEKGIQKRRRVIRIVGPTIKQTEMIVDYNMAKITEELPKLGLRGLVERMKSDRMYRVGESGIFMGGFDSQEDNLRGGEADLIIVEETGSSDPEQYNYQMKSVLKPQLLKTRGRMLHLTTLPPVPDHPFETETIPQARLDNAFYSYTIYQDPLATPEIIADAIKDCGGEHTAEFRREYLNESVRDESMVIVPHFDEAVHVKPLHFPAICRPQVTIDWGGVRDKTVALLHYYDWTRDKLCFWDERVFDPNTPTDLILPAFREMEQVPGELVVQSRHADVPGQLLVDLQTLYGYEVATPPKDEWRVAVNNFALLFTQNKVEIDPRCKVLIQTVRSGRFNKQRTDFDRTKPLGHMDAIAAGMYANRVQDRTNPFGRVIPVMGQGQYVPQREVDQMTKIATAIQPKRFGRYAK